MGLWMIEQQLLQSRTNEWRRFGTGYGHPWIASGFHVMGLQSIAEGAGNECITASTGPLSVPNAVRFEVLRCMRLCL